MPLRLTDDQLDAVILAARPLRPCDRDAFLRQVADALVNGGGAVGDGDCQPRRPRGAEKFFDPPDLGHSISKYDR